MCRLDVESDWPHGTSVATQMLTFFGRHHLLNMTCHDHVCYRLPGFHLTRRQLNVLPNPEEAYARRGAPWTFNAGAFLQALLQLRQDGKAFSAWEHHKLVGLLASVMRLCKSVARTQERASFLRLTMLWEIQRKLRYI